MTNAEKYLKDGAGGVQDFTEALMKFNEERKFVTDWYAKSHSKDFMDLFLKEQAKPTLTEDEKVILRNLRDKYKYIGREGMLYIAEQERNSNFVSQVVIDEYKSDPFQFIKEGEEYPIEELLK